jgi:hypothetical protein
MRTNIHLIAAVAAGVMLARCGGGGTSGQGPGPTPTPLASVAGTWRGADILVPSQSGPADHCIVQYFRATPASFSTPVTLTLTQDGTNVRGTYSGEDRVAFAEFECQVTGTYVNGELSLELADCSRQRFGLNPTCNGQLQRTGGRFVGRPSNNLNGDWRATVATWNIDGASTGTVDWVSQASFPR